MRHRRIPYVEWIGSLRIWQSFYTTTRGATPRLMVLVRDDVLGSSHLVVMPHLICCAPPPSPGARIGAGIQFWVIGTAVIVCWPATWWRTSCGNRAIACLKFRKISGNEMKRVTKNNIGYAGTEVCCHYVEDNSQIKYEIGKQPRRSPCFLRILHVLYFCRSIQYS